MTKADLIRAIQETCTAPVEPRGSAAARLATRSPAAGGGLAAEPAAAVPRRRGTLRDPQTGDRVRLARRSAGTRRRR